ncbi:MAG: queuosine precursor transporter [Bdellovibrionales bacterium]|nr:queuosine precursor transporter [Bdellovibrionales bacterium]
MMSDKQSLSRRDKVFLLLGGIFITNAIVAELIGGKLFAFGPFVMSMGILPWPVVFLTTDLINEHYGKDGVKFLTFSAVGLIAFTFMILFLALQIPAVNFSPVDDHSFQVVFGQSNWIIIGSITAFLFSQLLDVAIFWFFKTRTGNKKLWLRATGSTAISQLIDTFIVGGIAFWLPGKITTANYISLSFTNYTYKLGIAVALTPLIYLGHYLATRYLRKK